MLPWREHQGDSREAFCNSAPKSSVGFLTLTRNSVHQLGVLPFSILTLRPWRRQQVPRGKAQSYALPSPTVTCASEQRQRLEVPVTPYLGSINLLDITLLEWLTELRNILLIRLLVYRKRNSQLKSCKGQGKNKGQGASMLSPSGPGSSISTCSPS